MKRASVHDRGMTSRVLIGVIILASFQLRSSFAQELFINTEPASNMPRYSYGFRLGSENFLEDHALKSRTDLEFMYGFSADLMAHVTAHASNFYGSYNFNNFGVYGKYRLYT